MFLLFLGAFVVLLVLFALGVATNPNKRYPENADVGDHLWVILVIIVAIPAAIYVL